MVSAMASQQRSARSSDSLRQPPTKYSTYLRTQLTYENGTIIISRALFSNLIYALDMILRQELSIQTLAMAIILLRIHSTNILRM